MNLSPIPVKKHTFSAGSADSNDRKGVGERKESNALSLAEAQRAQRKMRYAGETRIVRKFNSAHTSCPCRAEVKNWLVFLGYGKLLKQK